MLKLLLAHHTLKLLLAQHMLKLSLAQHTAIFKKGDVKESDTTGIMAALTEQCPEIQKNSTGKYLKSTEQTKNPLMTENIAFAVGHGVLRKDFRRKKRAGGKLDMPYIGPYLITKCHSKGMYVGDKYSTIERISSAYLKPYTK